MHSRALESQSAEEKPPVRWRAKAIVVLSAVVIAAFAILLVLKGREDDAGKSLAQIVSELGPPSFLAMSTDVVTRRVKCLRLQVLPQDPATITNWNSIANTAAVWADSESCQRNARYFYDEMKSDKSFDGGGWYSSRSPFGEKLKILAIGKDGRVINSRIVRVDAVAIHLVGFVPGR